MYALHDYMKISILFNSITVYVTRFRISIKYPDLIGRQMIVNHQTKTNK